MENKNNLLELLEYINPATLDYQEWVNVGMALKHEGHTVQDWDLWSQNDVRYKEGECLTKLLTILTSLSIFLTTKKLSLPRYPNLKKYNSKNIHNT